MKKTLIGAASVAGGILISSLIFPVLRSGLPNFLLGSEGFLRLFLEILATLLLSWALPVMITIFIAIAWLVADEMRKEKRNQRAGNEILVTAIASGAACLVIMWSYQALSM